MGLRIRIGDLGLKIGDSGLEIGSTIEDWDWGFGLRILIRLKNLDLGLEF